MLLLVFFLFALFGHFSFCLGRKKEKERERKSPRVLCYAAMAQSIVVGDGGVYIEIAVSWHSLRMLPVCEHSPVLSLSLSLLYRRGVLVARDDGAPKEHSETIYISHSLYIAPTFALFIYIYNSAPFFSRKTKGCSLAKCSIRRASAPVSSYSLFPPPIVHILYVHV